jgi:hypothetical protein
VCKMNKTSNSWQTEPPIPRIFFSVMTEWIIIAEWKSKLNQGWASLLQLLLYGHDVHQIICKDTSRIVKMGAASRGTLSHAHTRMYKTWKRISSYAWFLASAAV